MPKLGHLLANCDLDDEVAVLPEPKKSQRHAGYHAMAAIDRMLEVGIGRRWEDFVVLAGCAIRPLRSFELRLCVHGEWHIYDEDSGALEPELLP